MPGVTLASSVGCAHSCNEGDARQQEDLHAIPTTIPQNTAACLHRLGVIAWGAMRAALKAKRRAA
eukprot:364757-Chlamydomonas_euryale.AAC.3